MKDDLGVRGAHQCRRVVVLAAISMSVLLGGCSSTRDLDATTAGPSTTRRVDGGSDGGDNIGGSVAAQRMQSLIDQLLDEQDPCAILTQKDVAMTQIDPTTFLSAEARRVLAAGVVDVYDHLAQLIGDPAVQPALRTQKETFTGVLEIVERYSSNPTSREQTEQIKALTEGPAAVAAQSSISAWVVSNCA